LSQHRPRSLGRAGITQLPVPVEQVVHPVQADHLPNGYRLQLSEDQPKLFNRAQSGVQPFSLADLIVLGGCAGV
jgi:hypothetical protein